MSRKSPKMVFHFYKQQFLKDNEGNTFNKGITDIEVAALEAWKKMTLQQREPFEELAKKSARKKLSKSKTNESLLSEIMEADKSIRINKMVAHSFMNCTVETQEYYFIAVNVFCKTAANKYYPAELALLKFTLQDGVVETFHTYINPEKIPIGYRFDAKSLSDETHQLPIPPDAKGEKNFALILQEIYKFLGIEKTSMESADVQDVVPLFTLEENIPMVQSICQDFCAIAENVRCPYEILSINRLLCDLKMGVKRDVSDVGNEITFEEATALLDRETYKYLNRIACQFHEVNDCSKYCCLSAVKRWAYAISENICSDFNIRLVAGKHFPIGLEPPLELNPTVREHKIVSTKAGALGINLPNKLPANKKKSKFSYTSAGARGFGKLNFYQEFDSNENSDIQNVSWDSSITTNFSELDYLTEPTVRPTRMNSQGMTAGVGRGRGIFSEEKYQRRTFGRGRIGRKD